VLSYSSFDCLYRSNPLFAIPGLNYYADKTSIGEALKASKNPDQGIGLNGSVKKRIVAVFIETGVLGALQLLINRYG